MLSAVRVLRYLLLPEPSNNPKLLQQLVDKTYVSAFNRKFS